MNCVKHPKYKAARKPLCACEACWVMWFYLNYALNLTLSDMKDGFVRKQEIRDAY